MKIDFTEILTTPVKAALAYALGGVIWIIVTDELVQWLFAHESHLLIAQTFKGLLFVGATTALVYALTRRTFLKAENTRLVGEQVAALAQQQAALAELGQRALEGMELTALMDHAVRSMAEVMDVELCKVLEIMPDRSQALLRAGVGWQEGLIGNARVPLALESQAGFTLLSSEPVIVENMHSEERFHGPQLLLDHGVVSGMSTVIGDPRHPYGVLGAHTTQQRVFSLEDIHFLQGVAHLLANAVQRDAHEAEIKRMNRLYGTLSQVNQAVVRCKSREDLFHQLCRVAVEQGGFSTAWIGVNNPQNSQVVTVACHASEKGESSHGREADRHCVVLHEAILKRRPCVNNDRYGDERTAHCPEAMSRVDIRSCGAFPFSLQGEVIGALGLCSPEAGFFETEEMALLEEVTQDISFALEHLEQDGRRREAEQKLKESEEKYHQLFEMESDALFLIDNASGQILEVNGAAERLYGYSREELLFKRNVDLSAEPEETARATRNRLNRVGQRYHRKKDGTVFPVEISASHYSWRGQDVHLAAIREISERVQAEIALRESEERLKLALAASSQGIYDLNVQTGEAVVTPEYATMLGYDPEELHETNAAWIERLHPDDRESVASIYRDYVNGRLPEYRVEFRQRMKSGAWKWILSIGRVIERSPDGRPLRMLGTHTDITERKEAELALLESETLFRNLFENHAAIKLIIDPDTGRIVDANAAAAKFYGWSQDQLRQMRIQEINTLSPDEVKIEIQKVLTKQREYFQFRHRRADRSIRDVEVFSSKIEARGKDLLHSIVHDITERKRVEADRKRLMAAIEHAGETVVITDLEGRIQYVNPAFEQATGYARSEVLGMNPRILKSGKQDATFYRELWETISSGRVWHGRLINKRKDMRLFTEDAIISPVRDPSGRITNYVAVKRDITENLLLADQLVQAQKMESVGRLAGGVAHDFNNMLGVILGHTEIAMLQSGPGTPLYDNLSEIQKAARRSADLTRQLLAFARKQTIDPRVLDLNATVEGMLKMLRRLIGEDIDLAWHPAVDLWTVKMDAAQIDQILANLCVNARDALSEHGKVTIETGNATLDESYCAAHLGFTQGDYVLLAVSDNGCGMDQETLKRLFEPFYTTKETGRGTGLGLSTVYGIIKQNNGFINVYSEPGQGTTFKIYIPRYEGKMAHEVSTTGPIEVPRSHGETILLVEDESTMLNMTRHALHRLGYNVLATVSPVEAIRLAREHPGSLHLLISDVVMPEMNGKELAERVTSFRPDLKCLYMSGYTANVIAHHGVLDRGVHFIQKPFTMRDLAVRIRGVLEGRLYSGEGLDE